MIHLQASLFKNLSSTEGLRDALQQAAKLEHATIPVYLYAYYSINPATNGEIRHLIKSVVYEEMLHLALVCNILNAIGGAPLIADRSFIPEYPGPIPGGINSDHPIRLDAFSLELVRNVFMEIEEPEKPLEFKDAALMAAFDPPKTIGLFYRRIQAELKKLKPEDFGGDSKRQVTGDAGLPNIIAVTDAQSAIDAVELIIEQGEGTEAYPIDLQKDKAHYYRFAEIYHGKQLVEIKDPPGLPPQERYIYKEPPVPFDPTGVYPVAANPKAGNYAKGTDVRTAIDDFNNAYTEMLKQLDKGFNGNPASVGIATGIMIGEMKPLALDLVKLQLPDGSHVGPTFEYTP